MKTISESTIICPICGHQKTEEMPTDTCQFFYQCENCKMVLRPNEGDCCVYCSYGTVKCPSKQEADFLSGKNDVTGCSKN